MFNESQKCAIFTGKYDTYKGSTPFASIEMSSCISSEGNMILIKDRHFPYSFPPMSEVAQGNMILIKDRHPMKNTSFNCDFSI